MGIGVHRLNELASAANRDVPIDEVVKNDAERAMYESLLQQKPELAKYGMGFGTIPEYQEPDLETIPMPDDEAPTAP